MATFFVFLTLSLLYITAEAQQKHTNISLGSSLAPNTNSSSWLSPSGLYAFGFYPQGNGYAVGIFLSGIPEKTVVWTANRDDPPVSSDVTLRLTSDGELVLQQSQGQDILVVVFRAISSASMLDSGNFVLYSSDHKVIWQSFDHPTDTILPGQRMSANQELVSSVTKTNHSAGIFCLKMQSDGNLVQYPVRNPNTVPDAYWSSATDGVGNNVSLNLDNDGRLYLLNGSVFLKNITEAGITNETIILMRIDADGIFRVYSHASDPKGNWSAVWESLSDKCFPKGVCGVNSYCVPMDEEVNCECLPGFDFVNPGNSISGCERNFTAQSCKNEQESNNYTMVELDNTVWQDDNYLESSIPSKEDCKQACLEDCNCEVAFFDDVICKKQRLPLRYGRGSHGDPNNIVLIKTTTPISNGEIPSPPPPKEVKKIQIVELVCWN